MRLEKHIHGFVVFVIILTGIICIYEYFKGPFPPKDARALSVTYAAQPVDYDVRLVSLDFINGKSYTTLALKLRPGWPAPEKLMVSTRFYLPEADDRAWTSTVGVKIQREPAEGERFEVTVESECDWCARPDTPKAGYFADVYVTDQYEGKPLTESYGAPVEAAVPVVVQAERQQRR
ncbi:MAG TPA: hypothetical protein VJT74_11415 [Pyrinomonadaceae bacterium]|nr:hypothetical protein [Pyrinomonadaceae bacterium]